MRLSDVQPKKNFSYIFVQFPGMKMNVPMLSSGEGKAVKEDVALCVQLNSKQKVKQLYFVHTQSIKPFDFTDEGIGAKAYYRVIKQKENSHDSHTNEDFITVITDEVEIVQKKSDTGYNFILMLNKREIGIVASVVAEVVQTEKRTLQPNEQANESVTVITNKKKDKASSVRRVKKRIFSGGHAFEKYIVTEPIRMLLEDVKRKVTIFSPAALDFIGPGDQNQRILNIRRCG
ncbi:hypothetical protein [Neobacillus cucumis]|uniref:Uncharacterized protein n=1 Tax=Neobacillus cucumis TaxID=1740721 RepID=A0A2N5HIH3_9BACI|nr:hypothetical protein [Neobacillus cucumis]PLS05321.1 hypothetical protein CVD27_09990 [Neobacillus cucumis]